MELAKNDLSIIWIFSVYILKWVVKFKKDSHDKGNKHLCPTYMLHIHSLHQYAGNVITSNKC